MLTHYRRCWPSAGPALCLMSRPCWHVTCVIHFSPLCHGGPWASAYARCNIFLISHMIQYPANTIHGPVLGQCWASRRWPPLDQHWVDVSCFLGTHQARRFGPMLSQGLDSVDDAGTTLRQRWSNLSCLIDMRCTGPVLVLCSLTLDGHRLNDSCVF